LSSALSWDQIGWIVVEQSIRGFILAIFTFSGAYLAFKFFETKKAVIASKVRKISEYKIDLLGAMQNLEAYVISTIPWKARIYSFHNENWWKKMELISLHFIGDKKVYPLIKEMMHVRKKLDTPYSIMTSEELKILAKSEDIPEEKFLTNEESEVLLDKFDDLKKKLLKIFADT